MPNPLRRLRTTALWAVCGLTLAGCQTSEGVTWPAFGIYRLPYADGTQVRVSRDFTTHSPIGRYDLTGQGGGDYSIVAAADGWIRFIVDHNLTSGGGNNNYVWIEHPYPYCQPAGVTWPGKPANYHQTCVPCQGICNEWTKYSHMSPNSTTVDAGLAEGDWVTAGTFLGYEDDIGHANGEHLHWQVTKVDPDHPLSDYADGYAFDWSNDGWVAFPDVLPSICGIGILMAGETHTAGPCPASSSRSPMTLSLLWRSEQVGEVPATVTALVDVDRAGRLTLTGVQLQSPLTVNYGVSRISLNGLRLVRPVTIDLGSSGVGRLPADQLIWSAALVIIGPDGSQTRQRLDGPLRGFLDVALAGSTLRLRLDAGGLGTLEGSGVIP
jgi:hypothetical protein